DRAADLGGSPDAGGFLGIDENLGAEAATDIRRNDAELVFGRNADKGREDETRDMRVLAGGMKRVDARTLVVFADGGTGLHRIRDQTVVLEVEPDHTIRLCKGGFRLGLIAELPLEAGVARRFGMYLRSLFVLAGV